MHIRKNGGISSRVRAPQPRSFLCGTHVLTAGALSLCVLTGCARVLTIRQDEHVNTAVKRDGEPLELTIVCVYPEDLKQEVNRPLDPTNANLITADKWYEKRPVSADPKENQGRFDLPAEQIHIMTGEDNPAHARKIGSALRGNAIDKGPIKKTFWFKFGPVLHDSQSAIYVFPKFTGRDGKILPVRPAVFSPPGDFTEQLEVDIGSDGKHPGHEAGQYIRPKSPRVLHPERDQATSSDSPRR